MIDLPTSRTFEMRSAPSRPLFRTVPFCALFLWSAGACGSTVTFPPILTSYSESTSPTRPVGTITSPVADLIADLSNARRRTADVGELVTNAQLMRAAQLHADQMASLRITGHHIPQAPYPHLRDRVSAAGYKWASIGENLAAGQTSAEEAVESWMESPSHRRNLLSGDFTEIGTGFATDLYGRRYFVQVFGRPRGKN
jgi:uncharacterized protein YkwD